MLHIKPQGMSFHYSLCASVPMLATLLLQNLFWSQKVQKASLRHCIFYIAGIQNGIQSFGCVITQMLRYLLLNAVFQTQSFTSVNRHGKGGSKMGREYVKLWNHLVLNTESALATTTQILCPHAHVKTGQIGTYRVNTFSPSSSTGQHGIGVTYHRAVFTAHTCQLMLKLWTSISIDLQFSIWMMTISMMLNWLNSLHKICKLK